MTKDGGGWTPGGGETLSGRFVIQCKFTAKRDSNLHLFDLSDELEKAKRLVAEGRCDQWVLLTNARGSLESRRFYGKIDFALMGSNGDLMRFDPVMT